MAKEKPVIFSRKGLEIAYKTAGNRITHHSIDTRVVLLFDIM